MKTIQYTLKYDYLLVLLPEPVVNKFYLVFSVFKDNYQYERNIIFIIIN